MLTRFLYLTIILFMLIAANKGDYQRLMYYEKANKEEQKKLQEIICNQKLTKQQQHDAIADWAKMQSEEIQALYEKEEKEINRIEALKPEMIRKSNMSEEAKKVALELTSLSNNMTITSEEEANAYEAIMSNLPTEIQQQVYSFTLLMMKGT